MFKFRTKGNYKKTTRDLDKMKNVDVSSTLAKYGQIGVDRLAKATPVLTGETANAWDYKVVKTKKGYKLIFTNSHKSGEYKVVILIIHGHVTKSGTWIEGNDFVTPIADQLCEEIKSDI